jgi:hypothetical protein
MDFTKGSRFILKIPKKIYPLVEIDGKLLEIPEPPILKRTSRGVDCDRCEPSNSIGQLCEISSEENNFCGIKVLRNGEWEDVSWKINISTNQIYYWATSYFNPPHKYIENIGKDYILCRPQYNIYTLYFILKFKIYGIRKMKERYLKKKISSNLVKKIFKYVY